MVLLTPAPRPSHQTHASRDTSPDVTISLVTDDVYCVMTERETLGYIRKVGSVYVALSGDNLAHSVEVGQSLSWDRAIGMVHFL